MKDDHHHRADLYRDADACTDVAARIEHVRAILSALRGGALGGDLEGAARTDLVEAVLGVSCDSLARLRDEIDAEAEARAAIAGRVGRG